MAKDVLIIHVPCEIKSGNCLKRWTWKPRTRFRAAHYKKVLQHAVAMMILASGAARWFLKKPAKRRVRFIREMGRRQREFDAEDNLTDGFKPVRDILQRAEKYVGGIGIVWDDSAQWLVAEYSQRKAANGRPGFTLEVEDA